MADLRLPRGKGFSTILAARGLRLGRLEAAVLNDFQLKRKETKVGLFLVLPPETFAKRAVGALTAKYIWIGKPVEPCWLELRKAEQ